MVKYVINESELYPSKDEQLLLKNKTKEVTNVLSSFVKKNKIKADVFVGGSYAKGTLAKQKEYDIDVFVRFFDEVNADKLERAVNETASKLKLKYERVHGSRDYFFIVANESVVFEIVPVKKIKKPREMENSTDLSYFHVNYIKKKLKNRKLIREILLAKAFFKAQEVYGAESWIHGFSGYSVECLIIYYKTLDKMLKEFVKAYDKKELPIVIDIEKFYKNKHEILINMNESKRKGPIVFIEPTWKERNVLAALEYSTFEKIVESAKSYLKRPSKYFFIKKEFNKDEFEILARKKDAHFINIQLETNKQVGDIAGAKLVKGGNYVISLLEKRFDIIERKIIYHLNNYADVYIVLKEKKDLEIKGPSVKMNKHAIAFQSEHPEAYVKKGHLYYKLQKIGNVHDFIKKILDKCSGNLKDMSIVRVEMKN